MKDDKNSNVTASFAGVVGDDDCFMLCMLVMLGCTTVIILGTSVSRLASY